MPKIEIDYSNTIIYKITCKDSSVNDVYVGHTTNFVQRKHAHKQSCINDKSPNHNCKLYEVIRNNGGWNNWKMEIINFFNCKDHYEARKKEQEYFVSLNATLNSIEPMPKPKIKPIKVKEIKEKQIFFCEICNIHCDNLKLLEFHNKTKKHNKLSNIKNNIQISENNETIEKISSAFFCKNCDYKCYRKGDYNKHIMTTKHKNNDSQLQKNLTTLKKYICSCGKEYSYRQGLYIHKKTCGKEQIYSNNLIKIESTDKELIIYLIKENEELKNFILKNIKNVS